MRREIIQRLVRAFIVVEAEPSADADFSFRHGFVGLEINVLVFQAAPQAFAENVVEAATFAVHADVDDSCFKRSDEGFASELYALTPCRFCRACSRAS